MEPAAKLEWVASRLQGWIDQGDVLVFANQRHQVDVLTDKLKARGFRCCPLRPASAVKACHGSTQHGQDRATKPQHQADVLTHQLKICSSPGAIARL